MKNLKTHPRIKNLQEKFKNENSVVILNGYIGKSDKGYTRLYIDSNANEYFNIPDKAVVHFEQNNENHSTELFVDPSTILTIVSERKIPALALMMAPGFGSGGAVSSCVQKRIDNCKTDPLQANKTFCTSKEGKDLFKLLCDLLGDPKFSNLSQLSTHVV